MGEKKSNATGDVQPIWSRRAQSSVKEETRPSVKGCSTRHSSPTHKNVCFPFICRARTNVCSWPNRARSGSVFSSSRGRGMQQPARVRLETAPPWRRQLTPTGTRGQAAKFVLPSQLRGKTSEHSVDRDHEACSDMRVVVSNVHSYLPQPTRTRFESFRSSRPASRTKTLWRLSLGQARIEGVDVLVSLVEAPNKNVRYRFHSACYRREVNLRRSVTDLQASIMGEDSVQQVRTVLVLCMKIIAKHAFGDM